MFGKREQRENAQKGLGLFEAFGYRSVFKISEGLEQLLTLNLACAIGFQLLLLYLADQAARLLGRRETKIRGDH